MKIPEIIWKQKCDIFLPFIIGNLLFCLYSKTIECEGLEKLLSWNEKFAKTF